MSALPLPEDACPLPIGPRTLTSSADVRSVARDGQPASLSADAARQIDASRRLLEDAVQRRELVYGVTTGFGPLATRWVAPEEVGPLQQNLVRHLASGVGPPLSPEQSRAVLFCRGVVLAQGKSGARRSTVEQLLAVLNSGLAPVIPSLGTVGASGDLTPLAHVALALCGDGEFWRNGEIVPAAEALRDAGIEPLELAQKEGLALVNGTSAMTALSALNAEDARDALHIAMSVGALAHEVLEGHEEAMDPVLADVRGQPGQVAAVAALRTRLRDSRRLVSRRGTAPDADVRVTVAKAPQDAYTLRCQQQLFGAIFDVLDFHQRVVDTEVTAVTDNPVIDPDVGRIVHGGNFFGQHVAFAADALMTAVIQLAVWAERLIARLTDASLSGLPPFLTPRTPGIHSGFMGAQVTASALVAELRSKAVPASIQSVPTNANNQDVVTMGTIGALRVSQMLDRVFEVLAIATMAAVQAYELSPPVDDYSPAARRFSARVREHVERLDEDRPLGAEISAFAKQLRDGTWRIVDDE